MVEPSLRSYSSLTSRSGNRRKMRCGRARSLRPDLGTSFLVEFWSHPIFRDGRTLAAVIIFIDITERKQAEDALWKSEEFKTRSRYQLSGRVLVPSDISGW